MAKELDLELIEAAGNGEISAVRSLINVGANVNAKNDIGHTALMCAASGGFTNIMKLLIDNGADIDALASGGFNALVAAIAYHKVGSVKLLLEDGACVNSAAMNQAEKEWRDEDTNEARKIRELIRNN